MPIEHPGYGYENSNASCAHEYLLPTLRQCIGYISQGRSLKILDLGCGNGYVAARIAELGHSVTGVDVSTDGIDTARASFSGISYHLGSVYDEDLISKIGGSVDCVVSLEVIEHLFFPKRLFEQSYKILAKGGALIVSTPYHGYLKNLALSLTNGWDSHFSVNWDGGHIKFFSKKSLAAMATNAGFVQLKFFRVGRVAGLWKAMIMVAEKQA
jgi:2-polyprenyl-3-methyl-5-hydroxy-6-metoxy-1,4-benzoquinol methylase